MEGRDIRREPCSTCPYRRDVPSGVWAHDTYELLRPYDEPTGGQPFAWFACHATPEHMCHGWAVVHTTRGNEFDLLALRVRPHGPIPEPFVPLFDSGNEAADHGQRDVESPSEAARATVDRLLSKYERLRGEDA